MKARVRGFVLVVVCLNLGFGVGHGTGSSAMAEGEKSGCSGTEYRQFDFWLGDWDAFDFEKPGPSVARTRVDRILEGCVLRENYEGADGHQGESFSIYDASRKTWHQSWVTNRGELRMEKWF